MLRQFFLFLTYLIFPGALFALTPISFETSQHIPVLFYQHNTVPMVTIHVGFKAGSAYDGDAYGLAALTAALLNQGFGQYSATEVAEQLAETGALFTSTTSRDLSAVSLTTLTEPEAYRKATTLFSEIITQPSFPENAVQQQKEQQIAELLTEKESADKQALRIFFEALYLKHPYAHLIYGGRKKILAMTRQDVMQFYKQYFIPENAVIVIVGAVTLQEAKTLADQLLKALPHGTPAKPIPLATYPLPSQPLHMTFPASQTALCLGQLGITHHDKRYFPLVVGNYILGGGSLVSRLSNELREKRGFTYSIQSEFLPMPGIGPFLMTFSTQTKQASIALTLAQQTTAQFVKEGPTPTELKAAKDYLTGSFPLSLASNRDIATILLKMAFYHLPLNFLETYVQQVQAVTVADVKQAFQKTLGTHPLIIVSVGP